MWFIYLLSWVALVFQICFVTLSIAAGLYYLAELVEEYTVMTGRIIKYTIWATLGVYVGLFLFEELPFSLVATGLVSHLVYLVLLNTFPFIELTSPSFIASVVLVVMDHYMAFSYFASVWHPFSEVLAYFTICLWLVPFLFFVSLSANENTLPTTAEQKSFVENKSGNGDVISNYFNRKNKRAGLLSFLKKAQDTMLPQRVKKGY